MLGSALIFVATVLAILAIVGGISLHYYLTSVKLHCGLRMKFPKRAMMKQISTDLVDTFVEAWIRKVVQRGLLPGEDTRLAIDNMTCTWLEPREGKWPAIEDSYYLERRTLLHVGEPPDYRPTAIELAEKTLKGEYNPVTKKFYAVGMTYSPYAFSVTLLGAFEDTAFSWEFTNAVLWAVLGNGQAHAENDATRELFTKATAEVLAELD